MKKLICSIFIFILLVIGIIYIPKINFIEKSEFIDNSYSLNGIIGHSSCFQSTTQGILCDQEIKQVADEFIDAILEEAKIKFHEEHSNLNQ